MKNAVTDTKKNIQTNAPAEQALYRKYRPQEFSAVLGQEHIVKALAGSLEKGSVAHAYLFAGSRGTGKTSVARILARAIGTSRNDLFEIDAASNTGVDDVRALNESVNTLPFDSKYKVYILDEAHMLSKSAWNALLKTLEEPPAHVVFILATTEIEKVPETIVSRCQSFSFRRPTHAVLKEAILRAAKSEQCALKAESADLIALLADGSFRDAYGILQKVIVSSDTSDVSIAEVEVITGAPASALVTDFVGALDARDIETALSSVRTASKQNVDMKVFLKRVLRALRFVLLLRVSRDASSWIAHEVSAEEFAFYTKCASGKNGAINSATLLAFLDAIESAGFSYLPELPIELALVKVIGNKE
jgi:DNA polymerase-3 subunit gamma/tau